MNEEKVREMEATLAKVADCTDRMTTCIDRVTDKLCVLQLAVMMLAQKTGVDGIELMKDAQRVYDVERLNRKIND